MLTRTLIVNLLKDERLLEKAINVIDFKEDCTLLDFSGIDYNSQDLPFFSARVFDEDGKIEKHSICEYVRTVGELSLKSYGTIGRIRDYKINGLPIFWLTNFAEKHPFKHWLFSFFYFRSFELLKHDFFKNVTSIFLIIPVEKEIFLSFFRKTWPEFANRVEVISSNEFETQGLIKEVVRGGKFYFSFFLAWIINTFSFRRFCKGKLTETILLTPGNRAETTLQQHVADFLTSESTFSRVSFPDNSPFPNSKNVLLKSFPSPWNVLKMIVLIISLRRRLTRLKDMVSARGSFWELILTEEMYLSLSHIQLYFINLWVTKFFKSVQFKLKVFYEDEMYKIGRVISGAAMSANNKNVCTIGYQHGNISVNHAVYRIGEKELRLSAPGYNDALPLPDLFLVWGEYFKRQFLEWNTLNEERVVVVGNIVYINLYNKFIKSSTLRYSKRRVLWCTTSVEFVKREYAILSPELSLKDYSLVIRMHPNFNIRPYLKEIMTEALFSKVEWDETPDIYQSIFDADLVVCSSHSTVFIDCVVLQKPVIRLFNRSTMRDDLTEVGFSGVSTHSEFLERLESPDIKNGGRLESYLYLKDYNGWKKVIGA